MLLAIAVVRNECGLHVTLQGGGQMAGRNERLRLVAPTAVVLDRASNQRAKLAQEWALNCAAPAPRHTLDLGHHQACRAG